MLPNCLLGSQLLDQGVLFFVFFVVFVDMNLSPQKHCDLKAYEGNSSPKEHQSPLLEAVKVRCQAFTGGCSSLRTRGAGGPTTRKLKPFRMMRRPWTKQSVRARRNVPKKHEGALPYH